MTADRFVFVPQLDPRLTRPNGGWIVDQVSPHWAAAAYAGTFQNHAVPVAARMDCYLAAFVGLAF